MCCYDRGAPPFFLILPLNLGAYEDLSQKLIWRKTKTATGSRLRYCSIIPPIFSTAYEAVVRVTLCVTDENTRSAIVLVQRSNSHPLSSEYRDVKQRYWPVTARSRRVTRESDSGPLKKKPPKGTPPHRGIGHRMKNPMA